MKKVKFFITLCISMAITFGIIAGVLLHYSYKGGIECAIAAFLFGFVAESLVMCE